MSPLQLDRSPLAKPYSQEDWQGGYSSLNQEFDYWIDEVDGEIPPELTGTLFRNGPGLLDVKGQSIHHPFDGDGMVCAIAFDQGRAHFRNRHVRTAGYLAEQAAGKILYRGVFGTQKPGGWLTNALNLTLKNIANTNVIYWGGKLLTLWEAAEPHRLDPATLETLGLDNLDGLLPPGGAFGAHPWVDPASVQDGGAPCLVNFAIKPGLSSTITLYEFATTGQLLRQYANTVPGFAFIHDFAITPHYCIFFQNPVQFNPLPFLAGLRGAGECITFQPQQPTRIVIIPRNRQDSAKVVETQAGFVFHHANAFEDGETLVIDSVCYASLPQVEAGADFRQTDFDTLAPGQIWRTRINLETLAVQRSPMGDRCCEFPTVHPAHVGRNYRYAYLAAAHDPIGNAPHQAILKMDMQTGTEQLWSDANQRGYVGEPIFVPRHADGSGPEDDGWVLTLVYDAARHRSDLVILDAQDLGRTPVARLHLKHHVPYGLHGSFTAERFSER
jgi:all-trans-8'-apo-beta-carotenal 15,15'-oxygenase